MNLPKMYPIFIVIGFFVVVKCSPPKQEKIDDTNLFIEQEKTKIDTANMLAAVENTAAEKNNTPKITEAEKLANKKFEKWIGKYFVSFIEAQGEGAYNAVIEVDVQSAEVVHFTLYYQELNTSKKEGVVKIYGTLKEIDSKNTSIEFQPEVLFEGESYNWEDGFKLYEKDGSYFIETEMVVPERYPNNKIPLRKLSNQ